MASAESSVVGTSLTFLISLSCPVPQVAGGPSGEPDLHPALGPVPPAAAGIHLARRSFTSSA